MTDPQIRRAGTAARIQSRRQPTEVPDSTPPKSARPETLRQAQDWDRVKTAAIDAGLCDRCAAQYAWGIQIGFTQSHPPCADCQTVVDQSTGITKPNNWRRLHGYYGGYR